MLAEKPWHLLQVNHNWKDPLQWNNSYVNAHRDSHETQVVICQAPQSLSLADVARGL